MPTSARISSHFGGKLLGRGRTGNRGYVEAVGLSTPSEHFIAQFPQAFGRHLIAMPFAQIDATIADKPSGEI